ncbi:hypothetical protein NESM_000875800 [Novymonas esmeraldas]|uniref:Uncharacterized protein n=1 Tax=Novymonas esmeraldas TaxID=1808958 RepID=A0AAW0F161_9TRYP
MQEYFLFALLGVVVLLICVSCCIGCNVRQRRRQQANAQAESRYESFDGTGGAGGVAVVGHPQQPVSVAYQEMYYQQQPTQDGVYMRPSGGHPPPQHQQQQQPLSATVLYAAPPGTQVGNVDFTNYFPEARATGTGDPIGGNRDATQTAAAVAGRPAYAGGAEAESPYGEANYVPRATVVVQVPPPPQQQQQQMSSPPRQPSLGASSPASPAQLEHSLSAPRFQTQQPPGQYTHLQLTANSSPGDSGEFSKGKAVK